MEHPKPIGGISAATHLKVVFCIVVLLAAQLMISHPTLAQERTSAHAKSSAIASALAFAGTAVPIAIGMRDVEGRIYFMLGGLILGPVAGYAYMEQPLIGLRYAGVRALIFGGTMAAVYLICEGGDCSFSIIGGQKGSEADLAIGIGFVGIIATIAHNIVDIFSVGRRVESHMSTRRFAIAPVYFAEYQSMGMRAVWKL